MKVGIVGRGYFGTKIYETVKKDHEVVFFTGRDLLINYDIDWAIVASSNESHYALVRNFIDKGINVFCEKPLTTNFSQTVELLEYAKHKNVKLYVDDIFLYNSEYLNHKEKLQSSRSLEFSWNKFGSFKDTIINNLLYHDLYLLVDLFGLVEINNLTVNINRINEQSYSFKFGHVDVKLSYNRLCVGEGSKSIKYDTGEVNLSLSKNNALSDMFSQVFSETADFSKNNFYAKSASSLIREHFYIKPTLAIVGGGVFGITAAFELNKDFFVTVFESNYDVLQNASTINQYRVHRGYHYPRSKDTACSSMVGNESFFKKYNCINDTPSKNYYCIAKDGSKTSPENYIRFLKSAGLKYTVCELDVVNEQNLGLILEVEEKLFDPKKLKSEINKTIDTNSLHLILGSSFKKEMCKEFDYVINCSYANLNFILEEKHQFDCQFELCEKPVVKMTDIYRGKSVVIMDGPFMCIDPYGSTDNHVMGNVVHAIHTSNVGKFPNIPDVYKPLLNRGVIPAAEISKVTKFDKFIESAKPFFKEMESVKHIGSMFTVRTVLPMKDEDDARPSLIKKHEEGLYSIFSGKISTCVDCATNLKELLLKQ